MTMSNSVAFAFALLCFMSSATASLSPPSQTIESCEDLFFNSLTDCYDYLEKGSRRHDHPPVLAARCLGMHGKLIPSALTLTFLMVLFFKTIGISIGIRRDWIISVLLAVLDR
ncbi:hypothetical protein CTI12_AA116380 [Artemisia annua]|uniref:Uncharacterized protein n=1 Tax=Artemisia annua TaxID=35608 RepID=A0A2U1PT27_ARTAN|nr:hypothetical protein CTI12_AA116380 [Artemisia annua]